MSRLHDIVARLGRFAPLDLAEEWDNVGLLIGNEDREIRRVLTCLTLSPDVAMEAVARQVDLVIAHHPVLFRPVRRLTSQTPEGQMLLNLIAAHVAVYSPHTAFDSAADGINQQLAESLGLVQIDVLRPKLPADVAASLIEPTPGGGGRRGRLPQSESLIEFVDRVKRALDLRCVQYIGNDDRPIQGVAVACGSGAEFLVDAQHSGCDVLVTGEARFHACLEARTAGTAMVLAGHYATERPAVEQLARSLGEWFTDLDCRSSEVERDPICWSVT